MSNYSRSMLTAEFQHWLDLWDLTPDGIPFETEYKSRLLAVRVEGAPAILKISSGEEERKGGALLEWYGGTDRCRGYF